MGFEVGGKRALVTGASSGIGAAVAVALARAGATVGICARRRDRLEQVLAQCREHAPESRMWSLDLSVLDGVEPFARRASEELGGVDLLVNNAGIPKRRHLRDLDPAVIEQVMAINYFSPVRLALALLPAMVERGEGRIVNVSSIAARLGPPREAAYSASKAALTAWSESAEVDLDGTGVHVHVVNPAVIDTELFHLPDNEPMLAELDALPPETVADAVLAQLSEDRFEVYVPEWFADIVGGKFPDSGAFIAGTMAWVREQVAP